MKKLCNCVECGEESFGLVINLDCTCIGVVCLTEHCENQSWLHEVSMPGLDLREWEKGYANYDLLQPLFTQWNYAQWHLVDPETPKSSVHSNGW